MAQYSEWNILLHNFSRCKLTYKEDRLAALEGLGMAFQEASGDRYTLGIFESQLPEMLLWAVIDDVVDTSEDLVSVPTWSWASKGGSKIFWSPVSRVLGRSIINRSELLIEDSGALRIRGVLQEFKVSKTEIDEPELANLHPKLGLYFEGRKTFYLFERPSAAPNGLGIAAFDREHYEIVNVLFLNEVQHNDSIPSEQVVHAALLLTPDPDVANSFRRIGVGFVRLGLDFENVSSASQEIHIS
ncbi:hypothetical protein E8E14_001328 [Neopestalotiopsis sp. 37M]|nr:hypothetical protein E8E14_001328 [Neopestalotiopsis sp. 37M]